MELVGQNQLPALCEAFLLCFFQASCHEALHNGHPLSPAVQKLHFPVHAFVVALAGVSSPVVFQIQFPVPGIYILVCVLYCLLQFSEILPCCGCFHMRQPRNPVQSPSLFQHVTVHTPAAVSESIGDEQVFVHLLLTVGIPHAFYSLWHKLAVVGVEPGARFIPGFRCGDEMGQHFAAVNALPFEGVVRHTVKLVPAYLCGHEHINAGFFQDLGKCPGVAEHIRQPKVFHIFSELILDEFAPDQYLACQRFSACQVAVCLHPHSAVRFPASLSDALLDLLIDFREILFDILINLGLRLQENVFRKHFHHAEHCGEGTGCFLMGVLQPPQPCHVNVGMTYTVDIYQGMLIHLVNLLIQHLIRLMKGFIEFITSRICPVNAVTRFIQCVSQIIADGIVFLQVLNGLKHHGSQIVKVVCLFIQPGQICPFDLMLLHRGHTAALQP